MARLYQKRGGALVECAEFTLTPSSGLSHVIGICLAEEGGGAGTWVNVDQDGLPIKPPRRYFDAHPIYASLRRVLVDGQIMQEHKKFYYRAAEIGAGPLAGKRARWISPVPLEGFRVFPSFLKDGAEIDRWYCGAYQAVDTTPDAAQAAKLLGSRPGLAPFVNVSFTTMQGLCRNRNVNGVSGFDMWDIYQVAEIQLLALIEAGTSDSQAFYGPGWVDGQWRKVGNVAQNDSKCVDDPTVASASWRGHVGLWGNVWQAVDGLRVNGTTRKLHIYKNDGSRQWVETSVVCPKLASQGATSMHSYPRTFLHASGNGFDFSDVFIGIDGTADPANGSVPDGFWSWDDWSGNADNVMYLGGSWQDASRAGLFAYSLYNPASHVNVSMGCRIAKS